MGLARPYLASVALTCTLPRYYYYWLRHPRCIQVGDRGALPSRVVGRGIDGGGGGDVGLLGHK